MFFCCSKKRFHNKSIIQISLLMTFESLSQPREVKGNQKKRVIMSYFFLINPMLISVGLLWCHVLSSLVG